MRVEATPLVPCFMHESPAKVMANMGRLCRKQHNVRVRCDTHAKPCIHTFVASGNLRHYRRGERARKPRGRDFAEASSHIETAARIVQACLLDCVCGYAHRGWPVVWMNDHALVFILPDSGIYNAECICQGYAPRVRYPIHVALALVGPFLGPTHTYW